MTGSGMSHRRGSPSQSLTTARQSLSGCLRRQLTTGSVVVAAGFVAGLLLLTGCMSVAGLVRQDRMPQAARRCDKLETAKERSACFTVLADANLARLRYREAIAAYERAGMPSDDPRRLNALYLLGLDRVRAGSFADAEQALAEAGYGPAEVPLAIAIECLRMQPSEAWMPRAVEYLERAGFETKEAEAVVGRVALAAAIQQENHPKVEALGEKYLAHAGVDPGPEIEQLRKMRERARAEQEQSAGEAECQGVRDELAHVEQITHTNCDPALTLWLKEPIGKEVVSTYHVIGPTTGVVNYTVERRLVLVDRGPGVRSCYDATSRRYRHVAEELERCGAVDAVKQARAREEESNANRDLVPEPKDGGQQGAHFPYAVAVRFIPPKKDYGRGKKPGLKQEGLRDMLRTLLTDSGIFEWVEGAADATADYVVEAEMTQFQVRTFRFVLGVTIRVLDRAGALVVSASTTKVQAITNMLQWKELVHSAAHEALRDALDKLESELPDHISDLAPPDLNAQARVAGPSVMAALDEAREQLARCLPPGDPGSKVPVRVIVTVSPQGQIVEVDVEDSPSIRGASSDCIRATLETTALPATGTEPLKFKRTLLLAPPAKKASPRHEPPGPAESPYDEPLGPAETPYDEPRNPSDANRE